MNRHLSSQEISNWMSGERGPDQERHARECAQCASEIARLENAFSMFRASAQQWADQCYGADARSDARRPTRRRSALTLLAGLATAAMIAVFLLPLSLPHRPAEEPFVRVPYVVPPAPYERTELVRMDVPVATLIASGLEVRVPALGGTVTADVLLGQDGRALALRLVRHAAPSINRRFNP
jgi:hypothetical protein